VKITVEEEVLEAAASVVLEVEVVEGVVVIVVSPFFLRHSSVLSPGT